jgi:hypothetical protein
MSQPRKRVSRRRGPAAKGCQDSITSGDSRRSPSSSGSKLAASMWPCTRTPFSERRSERSDGVHGHTMSTSAPARASPRAMPQARTRPPWMAGKIGNGVTTNTRIGYYISASAPQRHNPTRRYAAHWPSRVYATGKRQAGAASVRRLRPGRAWSDCHSESRQTARHVYRGTCPWRSPFGRFMSSKLQLTHGRSKGYCGQLKDQRPRNGHLVTAANPAVATVNGMSCFPAGSRYPG